MKRYEVVHKEWLVGDEWVVEVRDNESKLSWLNAISGHAPAAARAAAKRAVGGHASEYVKYHPWGEHIAYRFIITTYGGN